ncbi:hypothetical protein GGR57DRAFT_506600 [Xylariaceae sp. FL1272]|nr:hypothetical protein GGR57DRAFT_506600 [Xylariaceae sp. FL1272]
MASNNNDGEKDEKKKDKDRRPQPPRGQKARELPVDPNGVPAHPDARGVVVINGLFRCVCGSVFYNEHHNHSSHLSHRHQPKSSYNKKQAGRLYWCRDCTEVFKNFHSYLGHHRGAHNGNSKTEELKKHNFPSGFDYDERVWENEEPRDEVPGFALPQQYHQKDDDQDEGGVGGQQGVQV